MYAAAADIAGIALSRKNARVLLFAVLIHCILFVSSMFVYECLDEASTTRLHYTLHIVFLRNISVRSLFNCRRGRKYFTFRLHAIVYAYNQKM